MTTTDQPQLQHDARCLSWRYEDPEVCTCRGDDGWTPATFADGRLLPFDLETTSPDPLTARIVTATVIDIVPFPRRRTHVQNWLSDVDGEEIPAEAAAIHGVTTEHARANGRPHREVVSEVRGALEFAMEYGKPICGANLAYDLTVVAAECARLDLPPFQVTGYVIDSLILDKATDRYRKGSRKLIDTAAHYGVELSEADAHSSAADALTAARICWHIAHRHDWLGKLSLPTLHKRQARWYAEQQHSFADYLRKKVAPGIKDEAERAAVLERADSIDATAEQWPIRRAATS